MSSTFAQLISTKPVSLSFGAVVDGASSASPPPDRKSYANKPAFFRSRESKVGGSDDWENEEDEDEEEDEKEDEEKEEGKKDQVAAAPGRDEPAPKAEPEPPALTASAAASGAQQPPLRSSLPPR